VQGIFKFEHWRAGKLIGQWSVSNQIKYEGMEDALDVVFVNATQSASWYLNFVDGQAGTPIGLTETLATLVASGFEDPTHFPAGRQLWTPTAASGRMITGTMLFWTVANAPPSPPAPSQTSLTIGAFLCNVSTGSSGVLWSFTGGGAPTQIDTGDILGVNYELSN